MELESTGKMITAIQVKGHSGSINNRRGFAAILCLKDRNTCLWLQQQRMHLLMMLCSRS